MRYDRVDLTAAKAVAVNLKPLLHLVAKLWDINGRIVLFNIAEHGIAVAIIAHIRQFLVLVGAQTHGFAHQFARIDLSIAHIVAAVNAENPLEGERLLLDLEFRRLDDMIGLHNFDEYALYGYAMKLQLLERQRTFRYDRGKQAFDGLMDNIRQQISSL